MSAVALALTAAAAPFLTACAADDQSTAPEATHAAALTVTDPWIRAADSGMVAAFGELTNTSGTEVHIIAVDSPLTDRAEIHEVITDAGQSAMRQKDDGIRVAGSAQHLLAPGGDHLMLMDLTEAITPGMDVPITLRFADGSETTVGFAARDFAGGDEDYMPMHDGGSPEHHREETHGDARTGH
ncbi:copper chaperone PCu(A)C [Hoyosella sp. YIM 151337]|uniref:copper chaperone PCu(A)C n=1 Tax=Hoyosella sp. YIM 151337 TaxID=2992742 RepID=UPI0022365B12|nr:copper chaperone PCu(A)C [Hoyosella sp. YIM 151337]MCW4352543.1 copper chaperone PCu(A)C [Hoyosella sp. YIM 151337]